MIMANLADVIHDKNRLTWKMDDELKAFCKKYEISPWDIEVKWTGTGFIITVKI